MKFNPNKKTFRRKISRSDADIIASYAYYQDRCDGKELSPADYDKLSDKISGQPSRKIY